MTTALAGWPHEHPHRRRHRFNGLVGPRVPALADRGASVRAVVRRQGTAPARADEVVGDFTDAGFAASVVTGADAVVTTVYPMGSADRAAQARVSVDGTAALARACAEAGAARLVHSRPPVSTTAPPAWATSTSPLRSWATTATTTP